MNFWHLNYHHLSKQVSYHILHAGLLLPLASLQCQHGLPQMPNWELSSLPEREREKTWGIDLIVTSQNNQLITALVVLNWSEQWSSLMYLVLRFYFFIHPPPGYCLKFNRLAVSTSSVNILSISNWTVCFEWRVSKGVSVSKGWTTHMLICVGRGLGMKLDHT